MTVATGAAAAQAIGMAFSPLITRLYGPEIFGLQSIFASTAALLASVAAMGYPIAIVLPRRDSDAIALAKLSLLIAVCFCLLITLALVSFGTKIFQMLNAESIIDFMHLIPLAMFIGVSGNVLGQWLIRQKAFTVNARYHVITAFLLGSTKCGWGFVNPSALGLILSNTIGAAIGSLLTYIGWRKHTKYQTSNTKTQDSSEDNATLRALARKHWDLPLLRTPQNLINAFSQTLPIYLLAAYFGPGAAGQYSLAIAVLGVPISLIGGSVMAVFYPRINEAIRHGEDARALIVKTTTAMAATGALPFLTIIFAGPWIFEFVFGTGWHTAGEYSQWLAVWLFFQYINKPAISAIPALNLQGWLLTFEIFSSGAKVLALWLGFNCFESAAAAIALFSTSGSIASAWLILRVNKFARKKNHE